MSSDTAEDTNKGNNNGAADTTTYPLPPRGFVQQLKDFQQGYTMTGGDYGALTQLFFDNLSTLLGALFAIQDLVNFADAPLEDVNHVIWSKIVPGVGLTMVVGNCYYTWQAIRLTKTWGRPYTAQPYGLNTPAAFAFVFNIMVRMNGLCTMPVLRLELSSSYTPFIVACSFAFSLSLSCKQTPSILPISEPSGRPRPSTWPTRWPWRPILSQG